MTDTPSQSRKPKDAARFIGNHKLDAATLMMGHGFDPALSEGSLKAPIFLTSTYVFETAADGKRFFEGITGKSDGSGKAAGLVYSRFNGPNQEILEDRLAIWEDAEAALSFSSGMTAISTLVLALAMTHSPEQLNFVLVDFKGGATFAGMADMPHVSAIITNLGEEISLVDRMQDALQGEMVRRQELLRATGPFANVADYEKARRGGRTDLAPLPALLIVADEFSELLSAKPEFVDTFPEPTRAATAQRARSSRSGPFGSLSSISAADSHTQSLSKRLPRSACRGVKSRGVVYRLILRFVDQKGGSSPFFSSRSLVSWPGWSLGCQPVWGSRKSSGQGAGTPRSSHQPVS